MNFHFLPPALPQPRLFFIFYFCAAGNYVCARSSPVLSQTAPACGSEGPRGEERRGEGENEPYILLQSRRPCLKTFHRQFKGNVNLSLPSLTHAHTHTCVHVHTEEGAKKEKKKKKPSSTLSPLYTHNALKWKTAHTGPGIEGGLLIFVFLSPVVSSLPMTKFIIISASESSAAFRIRKQLSSGSFRLAVGRYRPVCP